MNNDEEIEEGNDESKPRNRGVYLLPNLFTTAGLFAGFYAIVAAMAGRFDAAAIAIFVAMIMDGIDGRVARLTNTQSAFGTEYDSLSDMVGFGLAPALVMYAWSLQYLADLGPAWGKLGWLVAFIYTACAALRLARFNTKVASADKHYFQGLPSPSAAAVLAGFVWLSVDWDWGGQDVRFVAAFLTIVMGLLMVSNVRYYSFKEFDFKKRVPYVAMLVIVLMLVVTNLNPPAVLFLGFTIYVVSGIVFTLRRRKSVLPTDPPGQG
ncbi:MAG TPA: CDP-diacylglycerol--serine O-phosphatidyltransferase [Gammaproteobacteria bacterium]|nr:CDP-diacylglycerol--serine O-phosphatidyltransferase [Gammaproteobacteria bacterium]